MAAPTLADHARRAYGDLLPGGVYARSTPGLRRVYAGVMRYADGGGDGIEVRANAPPASPLSLIRPPLQNLASGPAT
jgi:hypothetical protein